MFEERPRPRRKMPLRTLILMVIALIAFIRFYWVTQQRRPEPARSNGPMIIDVIPPSRPAPPPADAAVDAGTP